MPPWRLAVSTLLAALLVSFDARSADALPSPDQGVDGARTFAAKGTVEELSPDTRTVVIHHGAISNFMDAMTMPFKVKDEKDLAGLHPGDEISFQLHVTPTESWVGRFEKIGTSPLKVPPAGPSPPETQATRTRNLLLDYKFTNELGQAVSLNGFRGQALAITFFYTRCPLPDYCPRLSKNFSLAQQKLEAMPGAPVNWHFLSVSFDTEIDTPDMLRAYGRNYAYDPAHWSFLTGPADKIAGLAQGAGVSYQFDGNTFSHNVRTLIIDADGRLQMAFPFAGDLSDQIVTEIIKAASMTNHPAARGPGR